jgi:hypothetical protein
MEPNVEFLEKITERWGKMPKKQIAKELGITLKRLDEVALNIARGIPGAALRLPETNKYGPKDFRKEVEMDLNGITEVFFVPQEGWPKTKDKILKQVEKDLRLEVYSPLIHAGMCINFANKKNLRKKDELLGLWKKAYLAVLELRKAVEEG